MAHKNFISINLHESCLTLSFSHDTTISTIVCMSVDVEYFIINYTPV